MVKDGEGGGAGSDAYRQGGGGDPSLLVASDSNTAKGYLHPDYASTPSFDKSASSALPNYASIETFSSTAADPYSGYGPPQIPNGYQKATLSSKPLTSYAPPVFDDGHTSNTVVVLDQNFHGAFLDVAYLPFDAEKEVPVVWNAARSGGEIVESVFGTVLNLVQCSERGGDLLQREYGEDQQRQQQRRLREERSQDPQEEQPQDQREVEGGKAATASVVQANPTQMLWRVGSRSNGDNFW